MTRLATAIALLVALATAGGAEAATLQQVGVFNKPMYVTSAPGDPERLFVVEREGAVQEVRGGTASTFADLRSKAGGPVSCCSGESGLQSIALAPDFAASGLLYAFYSNLAGDIEVSELRAQGATAPLSTLRPLLRIGHPVHDNHFGGQLQFGPDGLLYVSTGDGGGKDDEEQNAQSLGSLLGKILRIDPRPSGLLPYSVPSGNPFGLAAPYDAIWSLGLRNPYRFSFDRLTGAIAIADVGQRAREEVDHLPGPNAGFGANFGWNCTEGFLPGPASDPECATPPPGGYTPPAFDYGHSNPGGGGAWGCAVVGGYVARDSGLADLYGRYVYADYCGGQIRSFDPDHPFATDRSENLPIGQPSSFGEDACGRLYVASQGGRVARLAGPTPACGEQAAKRASFVGIRAQSRKVRRGKRAQITAWVSPCAGRRGEPVKLMRGRAHLATKRLDRVCSVRFRPQVSRRANFRATIGEDASYVSATSRKLRIKVFKRKQANRPKRAARFG